MRIIMLPSNLTLADVEKFARMVNGPGTETLRTERPDPPTIRIEQPEPEPEARPAKRRFPRPPRSIARKGR
jgi:hypothetical protein